MPPFARLIAVGTALVLALAVAAPAASADGLDHVGVSATGPGGRTLILPGDTISIDETLRNSGLTTLDGLVGRLSATNGADATVVADQASYLPLAPGATGTTTTPFTARISSDVPCGANVGFSLSVTGDAQADIGFSVGTGQPGPAQAHQTADGALAIPDTAFPVTSTVDITDPGRIKALSVHIDNLYHPRASDIRLVLVGPDGTRLTLLNPNRIGSGANFQDTVFALTGEAIANSPAPHTGTYATAGLEEFVGKQQQGLWKLEVTDAVGGQAGGLLDGWSLQINPPVCDPVAQASFTASPNPVPVGTAATFDASASLDPDHKLDHYHWDFGDGQAADTTDATVAHAYGSRGRRTATLTMKDAGGATLSQAAVTVFADQPPTADLTITPSSPPVTIDTDVTLTAGETHDPAGSTARYDWDLDGDGTYDASTTTATYPPPGGGPFRLTRSGDRVVRVRVIDDVGASAVATKTITVDNIAPTAAIAALPSWLAAGRAVTLDGSPSSDRDGSVATYQWDFDADGTYDTLPLSAATTSYAFTPGTHTVRLRVVDNLAGAGTTTVAVQVTAPPAIQVNATPNPVSKGVPVQFDASASSDPDGTPTSWDWDLDGDGTVDHQGATASMQYNAYGLVHVGLTVTDDHGISTTKILDVVVANPPPTAVLVATPNPVTTGQPVTFDASGSSDANGPIAGFLWDLDGNGTFETNTGTLARVTKAYPNAGSLTVGVRVVDVDGATAIVRVRLSIQTPSGDGGGSSETGGGSTGGQGLAGGAPGADSGPSGDGAASGRFTASLGGPAIQKLALVMRKGIALTCQVNRAATCALSLTVQPADARRIGIARSRKPVIIGTATVNAPSAGAKVTIRPRAAVARKLRRLRRVVLVATGTAVAGGKKVELRRAVLVRR